METLMQMIKAIALCGGILILALTLSALFAFFSTRLIISSVSAKERKSANVEPNAGDYLLGIIKFSGFILCPIVFCFIMIFLRDMFKALTRLSGFKSIEDAFGMFVPSMFGLFIVGLFVFICFKFIQDTAKESAIKRKGGIK